MSDFNPDWASPPGDSIAEILQEKNISKYQLGIEIKLTKYAVNQLLLGRYKINEDLAFLLSKWSGVSVQFWLNREKQYRDKLAEINGKNKS